jgi:hypothetical protein
MSKILNRFLTEAYLNTDGSVPMAADLDMGGFSLTDVLELKDSADIVSIDVNARQLKDSTAANIIDFSDPGFTKFVKSIEIIQGTPGSFTYTPAGSHISISVDDGVQDTAFMMRNVGDATVEAAFGVYTGVGNPQTFIGSISNHPLTLYTNNSNIHSYIGLGSAGHEFHILGDASGDAGPRTNTGAILSLFADTGGELTHLMKFVDQINNDIGYITLGGTTYFGDGTVSVNGFAAAPELILGKNDNGTRQVCLTNGANEMFMYLQPTGFPATFGTATQTDLALQVNNTVFVMGVDGTTGKMSIGTYFGAGAGHDPGVPALQVVGVTGQSVPLMEWHSTYGTVSAYIKADGEFHTNGGFYTPGIVITGSGALYTDYIRTSFPGDTSSIEVGSRKLVSTTGYSLEWENRVLRDSSIVLSLNWNTRKLYAADGTSVLMEYDGVTHAGVSAAYFPSGVTVENAILPGTDGVSDIGDPTGPYRFANGYFTGSVQAQFIKDTSGNQAFKANTRIITDTSGTEVFDAGNYSLYDLSSNFSVDWDQRKLYDSGGVEIIDYSSGVKLNQLTANSALTLNASKVITSVVGFSGTVSPVNSITVVNGIVTAVS